MGNILTTFKRFLSNKNTVTIIGVLLGLVVLFIGYNYRINSAVNTMTVPVAKRSLGATTQITSDAISNMEVLASMVTNKQSNIIRNTTGIINASEPYCVAIGTTIPSGSFFYKDQVVKCDSIPRTVFWKMPDGYRPVSLSVDLHKTYGNSMQPGDYIDLYARMTSSDGKLIFGQLISKLPILDVRDSSGKPIFSSSVTNAGAPAELLFAVPNEQDGYNLYLLLQKAILLGSNKVEIIPVPGNASYTNNPGETRVTSQYLMQLILSYTADIPDESIPE